MTILDWDENKIISTPFPSKEFKKILLKCEVNNIDQITLEQMKKIYILTVDLFLKGSLSTDGIASIFNNLFTKGTYLNNEDKNILDAIIAASELSFYIRKPEVSNLFMNFLKEVIDYRNLFGKEFSETKARPLANRSLKTKVRKER
jgi:hypothetical protein